jgi:hypothetical protein
MKLLLHLIGNQVGGRIQLISCCVMALVIVWMVVVFENHLEITSVTKSTAVHWTKMTSFSFVRGASILSR